MKSLVSSTLLSLALLAGWVNSASAASLDLIPGYARNEADDVTIIGFNLGVIGGSSDEMVLFAQTTFLSDNVFRRQETTTPVAVESMLMNLRADLSFDGSDWGLTSGTLSITGSIPGEEVDGRTCDSCTILGADLIDFGYSNNKFEFSIFNFTGFMAPFSAGVPEGIVFDLNSSFAGTSAFSSNFFLRGSAVAWVPLPAGAWLFGSALVAAAAAVGKRRRSAA